MDNGKYFVEHPVQRHMISGCLIIDNAGLTWGPLAFSSV